MSSSPSQFKCGICGISFESNALQRTHAKSDWHIYNLKRQMTSLPPLSFSVYTKQIAITQEDPVEETSSSAFHKSCVLCKRDYYASHAYQNHLKSNNHTQAVAKLGSKNDGKTAAAEEAENSSEEDDSDSLQCLFCSQRFSTLESSMEHMSNAHAFLIPNQESLFDLRTFIDYLSTVITTFQECLFCGQTRDTAEAIRQHMVDKSHCRLVDDAAETSEFEDFYDVPETESDDEGSGKGTVGGQSKFTVPSGSNEMHLPSGKTLASRSQPRQHHRHHSPAPNTQKSLEDDTTDSEVKPNTDRRVAMSNMRTHNAERGMIGVPELQRQAVRAREKKLLKMEVRARNQYRARVERGGNKQKFFKPDVPGPSNG